MSDTSSFHYQPTGREAAFILDPADLEWDADDLLRSRKYGDVYFSIEDGLAESRYVFLQQNDLPAAWQQKHSFTIAETGFGTGLNFLATLQSWRASPGTRLHYISFERAPLDASDIERALRRWPELKEDLCELCAAYPLKTPGFHQRTFCGGAVTLTLVFGDVALYLPQLRAKVDAWFLDGFAPGKNPEMWTREICEAIAHCSQIGTTFATFTAASDVRRALEHVGFNVEKVPGFGKKRESMRGTLKHVPERKRNRPWFTTPKTSSHSTERAIVIGGGLAGCGAAHALAKRGTNVVLYESKDSLAQGASGNSGGIVVPYLAAEFNRPTRLYLAAFDYVRSMLNDREDFWHPCGVLQLPSTPRLEKLQAHIPALRLPENFVRVVSQEEASSFSGAALPTAAIYYEKGGWLDPRLLCRSIVDEYSRKISVRCGHAISDLHHDGAAWQLFAEDGHVIDSAEVVVIANAFDCQKFSVTKWLAVEPVRGEVLHLEATDLSRPLRAVVCGEGYVLPQQEGRHLVGASYDHGDFSTEPSPQKQRTLISRLGRWMEIFDASQPALQPRVAFRTSTHDRFPYLGPVPNRNFFEEQYHDLARGFPDEKYPDGNYLDGLYVSVGHGSRGFLSTLLGGEILARMIHSEPQALEGELLDALNPARLLVKKLKALTAAA